jgi:hypothetical protein
LALLAARRLRNVRENFPECVGDGGKEKIDFTCGMVGNGWECLGMVRNSQIANVKIGKGEKRESGNGETERETRIRINRNGTPDSSGSPPETVACCRMNAAFRSSTEEADVIDSGSRSHLMHTPKRNSTSSLAAGVPGVQGRRVMGVRDV